MAASTVTTLAGLQESIVTDSTALFRLTSALVNSVYNQEAQSANTVNFSSRAVPSAVSAAHTEDADVDVSTVTVDQVQGTMGSWPILARTSKIALAAPNAGLKVAEAIAGGLARTVDTQISYLCSGFNSDSAVTDGSANISVSKFFDTAAELDATGYIGQKVCIMHPVSWSRVGQDLLALTAGAENKAGAFMNTGYVGNIAGVEIFVSPWVQSENNGSNTFYLNGMFFKEALGFGYRNPLIEIDSNFNLNKIAVETLGVATFCVKELTDGAGLRFLDKTT